MLKTTLFGAAGVSGTTGFIVVENKTSNASIYDQAMSYDGQGGVFMLYYAPSYPSSVHLLKFSSSGILQCGRVLKSNVDLIEASICNRPDGGTFIAGLVWFGSDIGNQGFIVKYSSDGSLLWQKFTNWAADTSLDSVVSDKSSSSLYALGAETPNGRLLCKFDSQTGGVTSSVWLDGIPGTPILGDTDSFGNVYIVSKSTPTITKITYSTSSGTASWCYQFTIGYECYLNDLVVDGNNNIYVALISRSYSSATTTFILVKMSTSGLIQWSKGFTVNSEIGTCSAYRGISVSSSGDIYLTCSYLSGPNVQYTTNITKFSQDGTVLWQREMRCDQGLTITTSSRAAVVGDALWSSSTLMLASGQAVGLVLSPRVDGSTLGSYAAGSYATVTYSPGTRSVSDVSNVGMTPVVVMTSPMVLSITNGTLTSQTSELSYTSYNFS